MTMTDLMNYLIESGTALSVFYLFYRIFLSGRSQFIVHRVFLTGSLIFSSLLPLVDFTLANESVLLRYNPVMLGSPVITPDAAAGDKMLVTNPWLLVYSSGLFLAGVMLARKILKVMHLRRKGDVYHRGGYQLIALEGEIAPFSFFNQIFVSRETLEDSEAMRFILTHELVHVRRLHSLDNLLGGIVMMVQWFNPFVWLLQKDLKKVHEYEADRSTLFQTQNYQRYITLLFRQTFGISYNLPVNHFHLSIKNRLRMLRKSNSRNDLLRGFIFIPLALTLIFIFACSEDRASDSQDQEQQEEAGVKKAEEKGVFLEVEDMPTFQGDGVASFRNYVQKQLEYPDKAAKKELEGTSYISFIIDKQGRVSEAEVVKSAHPLLDQAALKVVENSPRWEPGREKGKKVAVKFTMPIVFRLSDTKK